MRVRIGLFRCVSTAAILGALMIAGAVPSASEAAHGSGADARVQPVRDPNLVPPREFPEGPRKVIVGTSIFPIFQLEYTTLEQRLKEVGEYIDEMSADSKRRHGRGMDIAALSESLLHRQGGTLMEDQSLELEGPVQEFFAAKAREHGTYLVINFNMIEDREREIVYNAAVLFDRSGEVAGIYRKVFLVAAQGAELLEGGKTPGTRFPVFDTDFGRIGFQICFDTYFPEGWQALADQGAELVIWPSESPATVNMISYARKHGYYIVSATPRNIAAVFDPTGRIIAQVVEPERVVTKEIDLDYRMVGWHPWLNNGEAFREVFGDRVGFDYSPREDVGIFWSNDPEMPIGRMVDHFRYESIEDSVHRNRVLREKILSRMQPED